MSQVGFGPWYAIDGPPPIPPVYGLLAAADAPAAGVRIVPDADERGIERWINGVEVYPYPPDVPDVFDPCATGSDAQTKGRGAFDSGVAENPVFGAMTLWIAETCKSWKVWNQQAFIDRALAVFKATESYGVAHEFMTGARIPLSRHLADGVDTTFPNGDTPTGSVHALALLEAEIARTGRLGIIHCTPAYATSGLRDRFVIDNKTGVIRTINGNVVIADGGYIDGGAPSGHPAPTGRQEWIYATGPIDLRRSETIVMPGNVSEALDRGMAATLGDPNTITYRVERYYLADWDAQLHAAVLADPCTDECP